MAGIQPPKSPTLLLPRRSTELEDPGAHELESSSDEADVFSDARDGESPTSPTRPKSPIPLTRVEKVDDTPSYGQVPGSPGYDKRMQDAVPDEIEIIPEGLRSRSASRLDPEPPTPMSPIPRTVVEKVDLTQPSHGEVPGTAAHAKRVADSVPDVILQAAPPGRANPVAKLAFAEDTTVTEQNGPIPRTVVTRVDSQPTHGEVPGTAAYQVRTQDAKPDVVEKKGDVPGGPTSFLNRSSNSNELGHVLPLGGASPIAADGGFGPMDYEDEDGDDGSEGKDEIYETKRDTKGDRDETNSETESEDSEEGFGDDFDDFEEGAEGDNFGDFDDGFQQPVEEAASQQMPKAQAIAVPTSPFPALDFSALASLDSILEATSPHLSSLFPATAGPQPPPPPPLVDSTSTFLTERSQSLYAQLVAPPPLQPPNWVRSRIRRLFLVSLGVPVDLDEILPKSNQKKLILPYTASSDGRDGRKGPVLRLKTDSLSTANDSALSTPTTSNPRPARKRKGPHPPPEFDLASTRQLCATTDAALQGLTDQELQTHVEKLEMLVERGKEVLQYWVRRKEMAVDDKATFDSVIENLVRHARRMRK